jgi:hypothetical protein
MQKRVRNRLPIRIEDLWEPQWNDATIGWTRKFIRNNIWRTETINDMDDLIQDSYIVFMKVRDSYPQVVEAPLFMKLYQTALWRTFMDKGRKLKNDILASRYLTQEVDAHMPHMQEYNEGPLMAVLLDGPPELQLLMRFIEKDENLELLREPQRKRWDQPRQNMDQRLSTLLGIPTFPFKETLKLWLFA